MTTPKIIISGYKPRFSEKRGVMVPGATPYDTDFYTEMFRIRDGYHKAVIEAIRQEKDHDARGKLKAERLPAITISCTTHTWRKDSNVIAHSGLLNIDIDGKDNPHLQTEEDFKQLRDTLGNLKHVVACFLSASGLGVTFVIRVLPEKHHDSFFSILHELQENLGIKIDKGTHDVVRLRFVSYDPGAIIKEDFDKIPVYQAVHYKKEVRERGNIDFKPSSDIDSEFNFKQCINKPTKEGYQFEDGQKHFFLVSVAARCNVLGMTQEYVEGMVLREFGNKTGITEEDLLRPIRNVYKRYPDQHGTYTIRQKERETYKELYAFASQCNYNGVQLDGIDYEQVALQYELTPEKARELFKKIYEDNADEFGMVNKPEIQRVEHFLQKKYDFAKNEVTLRREYKLKKEENYRKLVTEEVWRDLQYHGYKFDLNKIKALMRTSFVTTYNPFVQYFEALPAWSPAEGDHITKLANHIQTETQDFYLTQFKKALVRMLHCSLDGKENRIVFTFVGEKQETGKSSFIRFLNPFGDLYYTESPLRDGKDTQFKFAENFIYNLEELSSLSNIDVNRLKAIISTAVIKERKPYAEDEEEQMRRCNFWASTNKSEFLTDTENTRWLCFNVKSINHDYNNHFTGQKDVDIHRVWAQAYHLYKTGFEYRLNAEEAAFREKLNRSYEVDTPEKHLILMHLKPTREQHQQHRGNFMNNTEILQYLIECTGNKLKLNNTVMLGKALSQLEFPKGEHKIKGKKVKGWYVTRETKMPGMSDPLNMYDDEVLTEEELSQTTIGYFGTSDLHKFNPDETAPF